MGSQPILILIPIDQVNNLFWFLFLILILVHSHSSSFRLLTSKRSIHIQVIWIVQVELNCEIHGCHFIINKEISYLIQIKLEKVEVFFFFFFHLRRRIKPLMALQQEQKRIVQLFKLMLSTSFGSFELLYSKCNLTIISLYLGGQFFNFIYLSFFYWEISFRGV